MTNPPTGISYRAHDWWDEKRRVPKYGIQVKTVGYECRWLHCAENNKPLLFDMPHERDAKLKELRRRRHNAKLSA